MSNVIFVSDYSGYKIRHNPEDGKALLMLDGKNYKCGDKILEFSEFMVYDPTKQGMVYKGYAILDAEKDRERIKFAKNYPSFRRDFKEVVSLPENTHISGSIIIGGNNAAANTEDTNAAVRVQTQATVEKTVRCIDLKRKLFKEDGKVKLNANEAELNEYKILAEELGL